MPKEFRSLPDILLKDKAFSKLRKTLKETDVVVEFDKIFPDLSKTVKASSVYKGILFLSVENSVLRNELFIKRDLIVEKVNKHFDQKIIVDIKFRYFRNR